MSTDTKPLDMDNRRDKYSAPVVDLVSSWPLYVPAGGFDLIEGIVAPTAALRFTEWFLSPKKGAHREIEKIPSELWVEFCQLTTPETVVDFANRYGTLRRHGEHFHRQSNSSPAEGDPLTEWFYEATTFRAVLELWYECQDRKNSSDTVRRLLQRVNKKQTFRVFGENWSFRPGLALLPVVIEDPIEHARVIVIHTINLQLGPVAHHPRPCRFLGCKFVPMPEADSTHAWLRPVYGRTEPELVINSPDLIMTLWMQLASAVAGGRMLKKCEGCGEYMDVRGSARPRARRMHDRCGERLRKRRYREGLRKAKKGGMG